MKAQATPRHGSHDRWQDRPLGVRHDRTLRIHDGRAVSVPPHGSSRRAPLRHL